MTWLDHIQAILMAELAHRVKNALTVVQSLASQTMRRSTNFEEFEKAFSGRLNAYARSQGQLLTRDWRAGDLGEVVRTAVNGHTVDPERLHAEGPPAEVSPKQALALGLILQAWLADVLGRLPDTTASKVPDLLPWSWQPSKHRQAA